MDSGRSLQKFEEALHPGFFAVKTSNESSRPELTLANGRNRGPNSSFAADMVDALKNDPWGVTLVIPIVGSNYD